MNIDDKLTLTGNETPDELEALLEELDGLELTDEEGEDGQETNEASSGSDGDSVNQSDIDNHAESQTANAESPTDGGEASQITSKDGKHTIPYDVLERERKEKAKLKQRLEELEAKDAELAKAKRLLELRDQQLDELGIEPDELIEDVDPMKVIAELETENPDIAKAMKAIIHQAKQYQSPKAEAEVSPARQAIDDTPEIQEILSQGGIKADKAFEIDDALQVDPLWRTKPLNERYAEVARRTNAFFESQQAQSSRGVSHNAVNEAVNTISNQLPASPSEIGTSNKHVGSKLDQMASASTSELQAMFDGMTNAEIDALLEQASI